MTLPLKGIKVLDLSRYLPGPLCTQILADFGAEVVKVEDVGSGDLGRHLAPVVGGQSTRFYTVNRNKKSITLDLRQAKGREVFKKLVESYDVVIDQFRPGVMDKMGLGYEELKQINPGLIYCAITGYGLYGPMRDRAGHDVNYLNLSGVSELTGTSSSGPAMSGVQIADIAGGTLYAVAAVLLAIISRSKTGRGQLCDVAMMDGSISLLAYTIGEWCGWGRLPARGDDVLTGGYACYNIYSTLDNKYVSLGAVEDKFWRIFCERLERPEYVSLQYVTTEQAAIKEDIRNIMKSKTRDEWVEFFSQDDICFTPVLTLEEMCQHPQVLAREMVQTVHNVRNCGKDVVVTGIPIKLSDTPGQVVLSFPELGGNNQEVLTAAGYSQEEIAALAADKVI